jgi:hypothetical protein
MRPAIGMTYEQAIATCWGKPQSESPTTTEGHVTTFDSFDNRGFLHFTDGVLTVIEDNPGAMLR